MNNPHIIPLDVIQLVYAYALILLSLGLARLQQIGHEKQLLWSSMRMLFQLIAVGYLLHLVFAINSPLPVVLMLLAMAGFSLQVAGSRIKKRMPNFYRVVGSSIFIGCGGVTFYFCLLVVGYSPWFDPRYLIPLAGMIFGNAMNGASLAAERLSSEMHERREEIECALSLGATSRQSAQEAIRNAYSAALRPTINTMAATGIVALPGMMTGQILSGTEPIIAVRYQIAILCSITGAVAVTSFLIVQQGYRRFFTEAHQLKQE